MLLGNFFDEALKFPLSIGKNHLHLVNTNHEDLLHVADAATSRVDLPELAHTTNANATPNRNPNRGGEQTLRLASSAADDRRRGVPRGLPFGRSISVLSLRFLFFSLDTIPYYVRTGRVQKFVKGRYVL